jgi:hypothetical protein
MSATASVLAPRRWKWFLVVGLLLLASELSAQQAVLRGRLQRAGPSGWYPMSGLVVTVRAEVGGNRSLPAYSGYDGMYYMFGVPPGRYVIEVWYPNTPNPFIAFPIVVQYVMTPMGPLCDIIPINIP